MAEIERVAYEFGEVLITSSDLVEVWVSPADDNNPDYPAELKDGDVHTLNDGTKFLRVGGLDVWVTKLPEPQPGATPAARLA